MMQNENITLPHNIIKLLYDKSNEKRKLGMNELEEYIKQNFNVNDEGSIGKFINQIKSLCEISQPQYMRRAAFLCYTVLARLMKNNKNLNTIHILIKNTILYFKDNDSKVVFSAAECLYNILKYFSENILIFFNDIYEGFFLITVNREPEVRVIAKNLDSLLKEIVNFKFQTNQFCDHINLKDLIEIIYSKINTTNYDIKLLIVSWISFINSIPEIKIINVLHEFLSELFDMLSSNNKEVTLATEKCLKDIYKEIELLFDTLNYDVEVKIMEILIEKCNYDDEQIKLTAFEWILVFLQKYKFYLIQNKKAKNSNYKINKTLSTIRMTQKDSMSISSVTSEVNEESVFNNESNERKIPIHLFPKTLDVIIPTFNHINKEIKDNANNCNNELLTIIEFFSDSSNTNIKLFEEILKNYFNGMNDSTLELALLWTNRLFKKFHTDMFTNIDNFMESFLSILGHKNDSLFNSTLDLICEFAKYKEEYIEIILARLLEKLSDIKKLLDLKGIIILKKLCSNLGVERVYSTFANVLNKIKDVEFICRIINILSIFLLNYNETESLRGLFKNSKKSDDKLLFENVFKTWCHNPVSCLIICFIAELFELSYFIVVKLAHLSLCQDRYLELAQLVQFLEGPVFINIRLYLLEPKKNIFLIKTLYGILVVIPQGKAYQALFKRLSHMQMLYKIDNLVRHKYNEKKTDIINDDIKKYLDIFDSVNTPCN